MDEPGWRRAQRNIHLPVNRFVVEIHAAQHRQDLARVRVERHQCGIGDVLVLELGICSRATCSATVCSVG